MKRGMKLMGLVVAFGSMLTIALAPLPVGAQISSGAQDAKGTGTADKIDLKGKDSLVTQVVNMLLWAVGIVAVVMIIVGGLKYMTAGGDSNKITSAKNTILYAVIGLVVAIFSYAIVAFVNSTFGDT